MELFVVGNQIPNLVSLFVVEVLVVVAVVRSQIPNLDSFLVVEVLVAMAVVVGSWWLSLWIVAWVFEVLWIEVGWWQWWRCFGWWHI